jgi:hypothetical protein
LAGFALNSAYGNREFTVGGCHIDSSMVPAKDGLVIEFFACLILIFLAFGVALDPRQAKVFGHATSPWLVGIVLGIVSWGTAFTREGYIGASKSYQSKDSEHINNVGARRSFNNNKSFLQALIPQGAWEPMWRPHFPLIIGSTG